MRLSNFLKKNKISYEEFGVLIDKSKSQVGKYVRDESIPKIETIKKIEKATKGKVKFIDFAPIKEV